MKIASIALASFLLILTAASIYEVIIIPHEWNSPFIPSSIVKEMQRSYIIYAVVAFVFTLISLTLTLKKRYLANTITFGSIIFLYITIVIFLIYNNG